MSEAEASEEQQKADQERVAKLKAQLENGEKWSQEDEDFMLAQAKLDNELEEDDED